MKLMYSGPSDYAQIMIHACNKFSSGSGLSRVRIIEVRIIEGPLYLNIGSSICALTL